MGSATALVAILGRSDSSKTKLLHTVSATNTPATMTVIQVNTSPVLAPKALDPPAPPNAPENPPPRPFCNKITNIRIKQVKTRKLPKAHWYQVISANMLIRTSRYYH